MHEQPPQPPADDWSHEPDRPADRTAPSEHREQTDDDRPSIWVGSLSDYNNGILYGTWLDAAREPDEIHADIQTMLAGSPWTAQTGQPAEEWGIFDHEGFDSLRIDEHENIDVVACIARGMVEHGPAFAAYAELVDSDPDTMAEFTDNYLGHYDSLQAYADQIVEDLGYQQLIDEALPEGIRTYARIDTKALGHDMWLSGDIHVIHIDEGGVWIFHV